MKTTTALFMLLLLFKLENSGAQVDNSSNSDTSGITGFRGITTSKNFEIFPNPAKDQVTICWRGYGYSKVSVYNIIGKIVIDETFEGVNTTQLDISSLKEGIYYVNVSNAEVQKTLRFKKE